MCNKKKLRGRSISGEFWLSLNPKWHLPRYGMWYMLDSQRHANQFDNINLWYIMDKWKVQILQKICHSIPLLRVAVIFNKDTKWDSIAKRFVKCSIINFVIIPVMIVKKKMHASYLHVQVYNLETRIDKNDRTVPSCICHGFKVLYVQRKADKRNSKTRKHLTWSVHHNTY